MQEKLPTGSPHAGQSDTVSRDQAGKSSPAAKRRRPVPWATIAPLLVTFGLGFLLAWSLLRSGTPQQPAGHGGLLTKTTADAQTWTCSMHPQTQKPRPGKCPLCGMKLVPVSKTGGGGMRTVSVSPAARQLMNIQTTPAQRRYVTAEIRLVGKVDYDETRLKQVTAWVPGRLDRLFVDYTGIEVKKGDHMVSIYSEELYSAQKELIVALQYARQRSGQSSRLAGEVDLLGAAREKLRLLGLTAKQIELIEKQDRPTDHTTIYSPIAGIVIEKSRQEGDRVKVGDRIYTVADINQVWVRLDAYESDLIWLRYGQQVTFTTEAYPGEQFEGRIAFIDPVLNKKTRTVKVRVNVPNRRGKLKPEMFVRGVVRSRVAAGGRVLDPSLAGKWISPMHPEIVKDEPGQCDICGMPLVTAESLGYTTVKAQEQSKSLVIPVSGALVTGKRAIVYVEQPIAPAVLQDAYQSVADAVDGAKTAKIERAFAAFAKLVRQPYDMPHNSYAQQLWARFAARLHGAAAQGRRAKDASEARAALTGITQTMDELGEHFAMSDQPTFAGREIVLGPRAGDYYLVRSGLSEGELVVTNGSFKLDSALQIEAKPSMMTPEGGGGGGGHQHGDHGPAADPEQPGGGARMSIPPEFHAEVKDLETAYGDVSQAVKSRQLDRIQASFRSFGEVVIGVDRRVLTGDPRMLWNELSMLMDNDAVEGRDAPDLIEADRLYELLTGNMRRLRSQFGMSYAEHEAQPLERLDVPTEFTAQLAELWQGYVTLADALAADNVQLARRSIPPLRKALATVDASVLSEAASQAWTSEQAGLSKILPDMQREGDLTSLRAQFSPLTKHVTVLIHTFGIGPAGSVYELHCPMALGPQRGSTWLQKDDQVRNPYLGSKMLTCEDRVQLIFGGDAALEQGAHHHE